MSTIEQEPRDGYIAVGRVLRPWGLRGDLKVESLTDFLEERFRHGARVWLAGKEHTVERARTQDGYLYVQLSGIGDLDAAEPHRGRLLEVPESVLAPLDDDEFYHHQLIGLRAFTVDGLDLGAVAEVLATGGNAVLTVVGDRGEVLLPFIDDVIKDVDLAGGRITVELIEGLLPAPRAARARRPIRRWQTKRTRV